MIQPINIPTMRRAKSAFTKIKVAKNYFYKMLKVKNYRLLAIYNDFIIIQE